MKQRAYCSIWITCSFLGLILTILVLSGPDPSQFNSVEAASAAGRAWASQLSSIMIIQGLSMVLGAALISFSQAAGKPAESAANHVPV